MFENFHRLYITIQYCGHLLLLAELHKHIPKSKEQLNQFLTGINIINKLTSLKKKKVINDNQWHLLYPSNGKTDSANFDISMCFILLRNVCPALSTPVTGWDRAPSVSDTSIEANYVRLKIFRNEFSHGPWNWLMSDATFQKRWTELEIILNCLGYQNFPANVSLVDLRTGPLDAESDRFQTQQLIVNELLKFEQKRMKAMCCSGTLILSIVCVFLSIAVYQYLSPGSMYRYYSCSIGRKQPRARAFFSFIPTKDPYMVAGVNGIEFTFEELMQKTQHTDYMKLEEGYRYYLNIDRCAYGGIAMVDLSTGRKNIRGPDVFAINAKCTSVFYYNEIPPGSWRPYRSVSRVDCEYD